MLIEITVDLSQDNSDLRRSRDSHSDASYLNIKHLLLSRNIIFRVGLGTQIYVLNTKETLKRKICLNGKEKKKNLLFN